MPRSVPGTEISMALLPHRQLSCWPWEATALVEMSPGLRKPFAVAKDAARAALQPSSQATFAAGRQAPRQSSRMWGEGAGGAGARLGWLETACQHPRPGPALCSRAGVRVGGSCTERWPSPSAPPRLTAHVPSGPEGVKSPVPPMRQCWCSDPEPPSLPSPPLHCPHAGLRRGRARCCR